MNHLRHKKYKKTIKQYTSFRSKEYHLKMVFIQLTYL